jgi:signal transduction histidine kinase
MFVFIGVPARAGFALSSVDGRRSARASRKYRRIADNEWEMPRLVPGVRRLAARRYRTWTVFSVALCSLVILTLVPSVIAIRRSGQVYREIRAIQEAYERNQRRLDSVTRNLYTTSIVIREFLLDTSPANDRMYTQRLNSTKAEIESQIQELRSLIGARNPGTFQKLETELARYWEGILPAFRWTPKERLEHGTYFLRQEQRPRRQSVMAITDEIARLNAAVYRQQSEELNASESQFREDLRRVMNFVLLAGILVSAASIARIAWLERRAREQHEHAARTGEEMRNLSTRLRHIQEEERKTISRELHDEVGQKMTALRMELGSLDRLHVQDEAEYQDRLAEIKSLAGESLRIIRDIAAGLRPSLLDDLGLGPALQRQVREFTKHTGMPVALEISGDFNDLPDRHRTYVYRIVQESLTNCAKHSNARSIAVSVREENGRLALTVKDDGAGFSISQAHREGLGLIGIEERVRELGGVLRIDSQPGKGTTIDATISLKGARSSLTSREAV